MTVLYCLYCIRGMQYRQYGHLCLDQYRQQYRRIQTIQTAIQAIQTAIQQYRQYRLQYRIEILEICIPFLLYHVRRCFLMPVQVSYVRFAQQYDAIQTQYRSAASEHGVTIQTIQNCSQPSALERHGLTGPAQRKLKPSYAQRSHNHSQN